MISVIPFGDQVPGEHDMSRNQYALVGAIVLFLIVLLINLFTIPGPSRVYQVLAYSAFLDHVEKGEVRQVLMRGNQLTGFLKDGTSFTTYVPHAEKTIDLLLAKKVEIDAGPPDDAPTFLSLFIAWLPLILLLGSLWVFVSRPLVRIERHLQHLEQTIPRQDRTNREQDR